MNKQVEPKLIEFQKFIDYKFNNPKILLQALTTPQFGNENDLPHYEILETLGDAVIKLIFSLKIYNEGEEDPGILTKTKQCLENNRTFSKIASNMRLNNYIFSSKKQNINGTSILADVFEAICGALYIDSNYNLKLVEQKIIDRFIENWDLFIEESSNFSKNELLEFLQNKLKLTPNIRYEYEKLGPQHNLRWIAKNPKFLDQNEKEIIKIPSNLKSRQFTNKKDAEKELSEIILKYLKENSNLLEKV
ncbi:MAG: ribonuclease III domain-containing protein [Candidatus Hermodarchaeota archaeon]